MNINFQTYHAPMSGLWGSVKDGFLSSCLSIYHSIPTAVVVFFVCFLVFLGVASFLRELKVFG